MLKFKKITIGIVLIFIVVNIYAQRGITPAEGANSLAMGGASVVNNDITAIYNNQAGLVFIDDLSVHVQANRRYDLSDLSTVALGIAKKSKYGYFGLMISSYGFEGLSEQKMGLSYARKLTDIISIGTQFDFIQFRIDGYGSQINTTFEVGIYSILTDELHLSAHVFSPGNVSVTDDYNIDSRMRIGLKYIPSNKVVIHSEIDKTLDLTMTFRFGIQYKLGEKIYIRTGISTIPSSFSAGFSYQVNNKLSINGAYAFHQQLGTTPGIGITWNR